MLSLEPCLRPRDPRRGFIFGRTEVADVPLATDQNRGVSREHFSIQIQPYDQDESPYSLILQVLTERGTTSIKGLSMTAPRHLTKGQQYRLASGDRIRAGLAEIEIWIPGEPFNPAHRAGFFKALGHYTNFARHRVTSMPISPFGKTISPSNVKVVSLHTQVIGQGKFGKVYKAFDASENVYAVKVFNDSSHQKAVDEQLQLARRLMHPHIVAVHWDLNLNAQSLYARTPYIVMELASGSLEDLLVLDVGGVETVFSQLFNAMDFVHSFDYTHRDLKPANVLVRSREPLHVLVSDFDFVNWGHPLRHACGNINYAAPEIAEASLNGDADSGFYNDKVDVWSMGIMLLEYCLEGGLKVLRVPHVVPSREALAIKDWNSTVLAFLGQPSGVRYEFKALFKVAGKMLIDTPGPRPAVRCVRDYLQWAIERRLEFFGTQQLSSDR